MPSPLPFDIEALIAGAGQEPVGGNAPPLIPPAMSPEEYGTTLPELRERPTLLFHREQWMRALLASEESHIVVRVGVRLALYLDVRSGRCDPSMKGIVRDVGCTMSVRTVIRALKRLEANGWISVKRRLGRAGTNSYTLKLPNPKTVT